MGAVDETLAVLARENVSTEGADAPPGVHGLQLLVSDGRQQEPPPNETGAPSNETGTHSHHHAHVSDEGLGSIWVAAFHGVPTRVVMGDINGDGAEDAVAGSEISIAVISGVDGRLLWAHHIGSRVTGLVLTDYDSDSALDVAFSTAWGGQLPRVGVLRGTTGEIAWEHVGATSSFLGLDVVSPRPGSDLLTAATNGTFYRLAAQDGRVVWSRGADVVPSLALVYYNAGHYLLVAGDLNGDGVADLVTASLHYLSVPLVLSNVFSLVNAINGATGERMWTHQEGADPATFGYHMIFDLELLDARGDSSADVGLAGWAYRYYGSFLTPGVPLVESFVRVVDGSSSVVALPIGTLTSAGPLTSLERYLEIERSDLDGDHRDEVYVLSTRILDQLLGGPQFRLARYALPPGAATHPAMLLLSDIDVGLTDAKSARLAAIDPDRDGRDQPIVLARAAIQGRIVRFPPGAAPVTTDLPGEAPQAFTASGGQAVLGTSIAIELRPLQDLGRTHVRFEHGGAPMNLLTADHDRDTYPDIFVLSTDGNVHVIDGITGRIQTTLDWTDSTELSAGVRDLRVTRLPGDEVADYIFMRFNGTAEAWDGAGHRRLWQSRAISGSWFDGNGDDVPDFVSTMAYLDRTITATNGATGKALWTSKLEEDAFFPTRFSPARLTSAKHDDLVIADFGYYLSAVDGSSGRALWKYNAQTYMPYNCLGGVDHDGDGIDVLYGIAFDKGFKLRTFDSKGSVADVPVLESNAIGGSCTLRGVSRTGGAQEDLLASFAYTRYMEGEYTYMNGFGRYDGAAWVWQDIQAMPLEGYSALRLLGIESSGTNPRFYFGREDHVFARSWTNATYLGQFTINGPFVVGGTVLDLDRAPPAEAIVMTADGLLWSIGEDPAKVLGVLDQEARRLGKDSPLGENARPQATTGKRHGLPAPGLEWALGALAVVAFARRRF